jgi:hypothetical protein
MNMFLVRWCKSCVCCPVKEPPGIHTIPWQLTVARRCQTPQLCKGALSLAERRPQARKVPEHHCRSAWSELYAKFPRWCLGNFSGPTTAQDKPLASRYTSNNAMTRGTCVLQRLDELPPSERQRTRSTCCSQLRRAWPFLRACGFKDHQQADGLCEGSPPTWRPTPCNDALEDKHDISCTIHDPDLCLCLWPQHVGSVIGSVVTTAETHACICALSSALMCVLCKLLSRSLHAFPLWS